MSDLFPTTHRPNVVAVILNSGGQVLVGRNKRHGPGHWQLPQGGIERGESPLQAVHREIEEETGLERLEVLGRTAKPLTYEWPVEFKRAGDVHVGQAQIYFLLRLPPGDAAMPKPTAELSEFLWVEWDEVPGLVIDFKRESYRVAFAELASLRSKKR